MTLSLCASCRHRFPAALMQKASFSDAVASHLDDAQSLLRNIAGKTPEDSHRLLEMQVVLQELCAAMQEESLSLHRRLCSADAVRGSQTSSAEEHRRVVNDVDVGQKGTDHNAILQPRSHTHSSNVNVVAHGPVDSSPQTPRRANQGEHATRGETYMGGMAANSLFAVRTVALPMRRFNSVLELVSASLYSVLESLAIQTRASTALLWLRPRGFVSTELVAPFVVGCDLTKLRTSAPYRVSENSLPCAVCTTGVAVNVRLRDDATSLPPTASPGKEIPLTEALERPTTTQLLMPVFTRYGQVEHQVLAVVHLLGSIRYPFPFSARNEEAAFYAANFLSTILSAHHDTMIGEWANHFYDPSTLLSSCTYRGDLDIRGDQKCVDDFSPPPMLIYRFTADSRAEVDPREAFKAVKGALVRKASPLQPVTGIKDLHRYATSMERHWAAAVEATTRLEGVVETLKSENVKEEVRQLRQRRDRWQQASENRPSSSSLMPGGGLLTGRGMTEELSSSPPHTAGGVIASTARTLSHSETDTEEDVKLSPAVVLGPNAGVSLAAPVLEAEEVNRLESLALKRLADLHAQNSPFITE